MPDPYTLSPEAIARLDEMQAWSRRLEEFDIELTPDEWSKLRLELREDAANHKKTEPTYLSADQCEHDTEQLLAANAEFEGDDVHVWGGLDGEDLICLASPSGQLICICDEYGCSATARAEAARDEFWSVISQPHKEQIKVFHDRLVEAGVDTLDAWTIPTTTRRCARCAGYIQRNIRYQHVSWDERDHDAVESLASIAERLGEKTAAAGLGVRIAR